MAEDDAPSGLSSITTFVLPVITAVAAFFAGAVIGAVGVWVLKPPEIQEKQVLVPRDLNQDELKLACAPLLDELAKQLDEANGKVTDLVGQVKEKESKVTELEAEMKRRGAAGASLRKELEAAKAELADLKIQLQQAIDEKQAVVEELQQTLRDLEESREETKVAKEESLQNEWTAFQNQTQLDICEKGNRKKLGRCRETVIEVTANFKAKYEHCIRSGQEPPSVAEVAKDQVDLPQFAEFLNEDDKITKDWYILLCDPALPEAHNFAKPVTSTPEPWEMPEGGATPSGGTEGTPENPTPPN